MGGQGSFEYLLLLGGVVLLVLVIGTTLLSSAQNISLEVSPSGSSGSSTSPGGTAPVITYFAAVPSQVNVNEPFTLRCEAQGTIATIAISFSGTTLKTCSSSPCELTRSHDTPGLYTYTCTASGPQGQDSATTSVTVQSSACTDECTGGTALFCENNVPYSATCEDTDGDGCLEWKKTPIDPDSSQPACECVGGYWTGSACCGDDAGEQTPNECPSTALFGECSCLDALWPQYMKVPTSVASSSLPATAITNVHTVSLQSVGSSTAGPVIADIDGDGKVEILATCTTNYPKPKVVKWGLNQYAIVGTLDIGYFVPGTFRSAPVMADIDKDGRTEIFVPLYTYLYAFRYDLNAQSFTVADKLYMPDICFLKAKDGLLFVATQNGLFVVKWDGGFTVIGELNVSGTHCAMAVDGNRIALCVDNSLYDLSFSGTLQLNGTYDLSYTCTGVSIADPDDDGQQEILAVANKGTTPRRGLLYVLDNGSLASFSSIYNVGVPNVFDVDDDGQQEILAVVGGAPAIFSYSNGGLSLEKMGKRLCNYIVLSEGANVILPVGDMLLTVFGCEGYSTDSGYLALYTRDLGLIAFKNLSNGVYSAPAVGDTDGDKEPEVAFIAGKDLVIIDLT